MSNGWTIDVSNPSPYERSDYVEVDLNALGVPANLDETSLKLSRTNMSDGARGQEIPYQIDAVLGACFPEKRVLTFLATNVPRSDDDNYRVTSAQFLLEPGTPSNFLTDVQKRLLWVGHYYESPEGEEPSDGFNLKSFPARTPYGVKLSNGCIETFFSLVPHPRQWTEIDYTGSLTNVDFEVARNHTSVSEMLAPFDYGTAPQKRWAQITEIGLPLLPWEVRSPSRIPLLGRKYELVSSNSGIMRAVFTVRSEPLVAQYEGDPPLGFDDTELACRLYRVFCAYPAKPFIAEDVFVLMEDGRSLVFRPYYFGSLSYPYGVKTELKRFEHIPDYFAVWKHFSENYRGVGFAADAHVRSIDMDGDDVRWRLQTGHLKRCIHRFMFQGLPNPHTDLVHEVGHDAWYERVFKPLRVVPLREFAALEQYSRLKS